MCIRDRVKDDKILNEEGLRNKNEFVNHKILDCMGDLYLVGYRIIGSLKCVHGGHSLTHKLLRKVFSDNRNYSLIELKGLTPGMLVTLGEQKILKLENYSGGIEELSIKISNIRTWTYISNQTKWIKEYEFWQNKTKQTKLLSI